MLYTSNYTYRNVYYYIKHITSTQTFSYIVFGCFHYNIVYYVLQVKYVHIYTCVRLLYRKTIITL
jgi:hypothetical protein